MTTLRPAPSPPPTIAPVTGKSELRMSKLKWNKLSTQQKFTVIQAWTRVSIFEGLTRQSQNSCQFYEIHISKTHILWYSFLFQPRAIIVQCRMESGLTPIRTTATSIPSVISAMRARSGLYTGSARSGSTGISACWHAGPLRKSTARKVNVDTTPPPSPYTSPPPSPYTSPSSLLLHLPSSPPTPPFPISNPGHVQAVSVRAVLGSVCVDMEVLSGSRLLATAN